MLSFISPKMVVLGMILMFSIGISFLVVLIFLIFSEKKWLDSEKSSPFECGFSFIFKNQFVFSFQFFLVSLIFLIFDVELILLFPYMFFPLSSFLFSSCVFISLVVILSVGFIWEWAQGMLDWAI